MDADWHAFCQAIDEGIEGSEWEKLYYQYRDMSKAAGAKKNQVRVRMRRPFGQGSHPARREQHLGEEIRLGKSCGEHLKDPTEALDKALKYVEHQ